jgi:hypothetical protein
VKTNMLSRTVGLVAISATIGLLSVPAPSSGAGVDGKEFQEVVNKAVGFLKKQQGEDGSFSPKIGGPGVTAMLIAGLIRDGVSPSDPLVAKGMKYLEGSVQKNGGIYDKQLANYTTSVAMMAFAEANTKGQYDTVLKNAAKFLKSPICRTRSTSSMRWRPREFPRTIPRFKTRSSS